MANEIIMRRICYVPGNGQSKNNMIFVDEDKVQFLEFSNAEECLKYLLGVLKEWGVLEYFSTVDAALTHLVKGRPVFMPVSDLKR
jgi:hypothetical protein